MIYWTNIKSKLK